MIMIGGDIGYYIIGLDNRLTIISHNYIYDNPSRRFDIDIEEYFE